MIAEKSEATLERYTLTRRLAIGGMAEVWLARDERPGASQHRMVLKVLLSELAEDPDCVRMFLDEARLASHLEHPSIVKILDVGESQGRHFIAMEYIAGKTVRQVIQRLRRDKNTLPPWFVLSVASKVCDALDFAHTKSDFDGIPLHIVHRDISPENIMVAYNGTVKVLDFGIAKASSLAVRTHIGAMKGKHAYMAPEQILAAESGCPVDHRADLYSLGVVMYEMLTSERPFMANNELGLIRSVIERGEATINPCNVASWLDVDTGSLVERAMAREPQQRFGSAAELRAAILDYLSVRRHEPSERHVGAMLSLIFRADADEQGRLRDSGIPLSGLWPAAQSEVATTLGSPRPGEAHPNGPEPRETLARDATDERPAPEWGVESVTRTGVDPALVEAVSEVMAIAVKHDWDAALARVRRDKVSGTESAEAAEPGATGGTSESLPAARPRSTAPRSPRELARAEFECGLDLLRAKDRLGALNALERAVELEPDNRLYASNLRLLKRQLDGSNR